jgi:hypothetical protein
MILDSVINFVPVLGVVWKWAKSFALSRVTMFLVAKGIVFFIAFKYLPLLFGRFYQWIYNIGITSISGVDFSALGGQSFPELVGLTSWILLAFKIDAVFNVLVSGVITRLLFRRLPFFR